MKNATLYVGSVMAILCAGCATHRISAPQAYTDPNMNFDKIRVIAVLPPFPETTEDQVFSGAFGSRLESALASRQSQWRLVAARQVLQIVNQQNLGTGYKNLQADYNAPSSTIGQVAFTPATNAFVQQLRKATGADAFIVSTYKLDEPLLPGPIGNLLRSKTQVKVSLLYANGSSAECWWSAVVKRSKINDEVLQEMAASVAANIGKGTLLQL